jgi:Flp pilus assembly protein TadD
MNAWFSCRVALAAVLPLLSGCSSVSGVLPSFGMQRSVVNHDIPVAKELDTARTRKLFLMLVDGLRQQGKSRAALAFLNDYNRQFPGDPTARRLQADCLLDTGDYAGASRLYAALRDGDQAAAAYAGLGRVAAAKRDWPDAVAQFTEATRRAPADANYVNDLGFALVRTGQYDRGLAMLQQAAQLDPNSTVVRNNLVLGLTLAGREPDAARLVKTITDPRQREQAALLLRVSTAANQPVTAAPAGASNGGAP